MVKATLTPLQILIIWKTLFFRNPPLNCCTVVFSKNDFLFEPQHLGSVLNYASAVVFTKKVHVLNVLMGVHVFPVLFGR